MAGRDFDKMIADKRRELSEVKRAATAEAQASIQAANALKTVTDEQAAIAAVARERVSSNKARVLLDQAGRLAAEIADLEQQAKAAHAATLAADAESKRSAAITALWDALGILEGAADAERVALEAKAMATGDSYARLAASMAGVVDAVGGALEGLGVARPQVHVDGRKIWRKVG